MNINEEIKVGDIVEYVGIMLSGVRPGEQCKVIGTHMDKGDLMVTFCKLTDLGNKERPDTVDKMYTAFSKNLKKVGA